MSVYELRPQPPVTGGESTAFSCVACGGDLAPSLGRLGSMRCHDCRETHLHVARPETDADVRRRTLLELPWIRRRETNRKAA
jgi:tRNA(Ile2) C34 agmatinyltransferase TiaS